MSNLLLRSAFLISATLVASEAAAQNEISPSAIQLGIRTGIALPGGEVGSLEEDDDAEPLSDGIKHVFPVMLEANYRFNERFAVGALFQYGFANVKLCEQLEDLGASSVECSGSVRRLGAQVLFTPVIVGNLAPWVGAGFGYEWMSFDLSASGAGGSGSVDATTHGFEWLHLQGGLDVLATRTLRVGPFVSFSLGQYRRANITTNDDGTIEKQSGDYKTTALHQWYTIGVRGLFDIGL